jgi:4-diphosphocytidyl-2-C-methyl-D-erythritol kinase
VPHGAGLGGGSSDAAAALLALNGMAKRPLPAPEIARLAAELGSDVPFFLTGRAARCRGRGERVEPLPALKAMPLLLIKPGFGVPTPWAYGRWGDSRELPGISYAAQEFEWGALVNGLERPVFEKYLILAVLKRWLLQQPESAGALMAGSGATCFAILRDKAAGPELAARVRREFGEFWTCLCETAG